MTADELQTWLGNTKIDITLGYLSTSNLMYNPKKAWEYLKIGQCYWFHNHDISKGPYDWMKIKITYKRSGVYFYKVLDKRYKNREEEYADIDTIFTEHLYPAVYKNPNPEYLKPSNFNTLNGRVRII